MPLYQIQRTVLSYCEIPQELSNDYNFLIEANPDSYVEHRIIPPAERGEYSDNWDLDEWIMSKYPELEGRTILIHIDY